MSAQPKPIRERWDCDITYDGNTCIVTVYGEKGDEPSAMMPPDTTTASFYKTAHLWHGTPTPVVASVSHVVYRFVAIERMND